MCAQVRLLPKTFFWFKFFLLVTKDCCFQLSIASKNKQFIERAKRAHSLFMSIEISDIYIYGIYVRVVHVSCVCFLRMLYDLKFIVYSRYPGNLMFAGVCVFNVSTRMGTIKIKWRKVS